MNLSPVMISWQDNLPAQPLADFESSLSELKIDFQIEKHEPYGAFSAAQDYIPTALAIFLAKPFFDAFLSEAEKDSYELLKKAISKLFKALSYLKVRYFTSVPEKVDTNSPNSVVFSIYSFSSKGQRLKFLFPATADEEVYLKLVHELLDLLLDDHSQAEGTLSKLLKDSRSRSMLIMNYDFSIGTWTLLLPPFQKAQQDAAANP